MAQSSCYGDSAVSSYKMMIQQKLTSSLFTKGQSQKPRRCNITLKSLQGKRHVPIVFFYFIVFFLQCSLLEGQHRPPRLDPILRLRYTQPPSELNMSLHHTITDFSTETTDIFAIAEPLQPIPSAIAENSTEVHWTTASTNVALVVVPEYVSTKVLMKTTWKPKTPEEDLNQLLEGLDVLLSNKSTVVTVDNMTNTFDQLDVLLDTIELEFPCTMLHALDALGARADLNGSPAVVTARPNVAMVMADSAPANPVRGLRIAANDYGFSNEGFEIIYGDVDTNLLSTVSSEAVVQLPLSLSEGSRRISFVVFRSDRAFERHDRRHQYVVNSRVISVNVENFTHMNEGEVIDIHFKPMHFPARNMTRACAYWHFADNGTGYWSQEGCTFIASAAGQLDTCRCTHLTHFAEVLVPKAVFSEENEQALKIISLAGCFLSLFGLIVIGLTAIVFRSWRNDYMNKIWIQLTFALLINVICFLIVVFSRFQHYNLFCFFVGVILHYSVLASFCWMLVAAIISYRKLVLIFAGGPTRKLLKASAFSWFFPLAIVTILVAVSPESYVKRFEDKIPNAAFCYPSGLGLWLSVYTPIGIIVVINWVLFAFIIRSVFATKKIQKHGDSNDFFRRASVSCLLVFLFGLPWVFGLFAYNIVAAYFFTLTTSYQGFVLFLFFVIINTKTRDLWLNKFHMKKKKAKAPVSSSLPTNRSEPVRDESEQQAFIEPTSTRTNITSLMSNTSSGRAVEYNVSRGSTVIEDTNSFHRYESEGSFVTAKSFNNICEDDNEEKRYDENSLDMVIRKVVQEEVEVDESRSSTSEKSYDNNDVKNEETTSSRNSQNSNNQDTLKKSTISGVEGNNAVNELNVENHDDAMLHRVCHDETGDQIDTNNFSQKQGNNNDSNGPEITIYNVPVQSASLIS